jgi:hypothetical protein
MTSSLTELSMECNEVRPPNPRVVPPTPPNRQRAAELTARIRANPELSVVPAPFSVPTFDGPPPKEWEMLYNFDSDRGNGPSLQVLVALVHQAARDNAGKIRVHAYRGASRLQNGDVMEEPQGIARQRAEKITGIIAGLGYPAGRIETGWTEAPAGSDGKTDWRKRRVTVHVGG